MKTPMFWCAVLGASLSVASTAARAGAPERLQEAEPAEVGLEPGRLAEIDAIVERGIEEGEMPGAVVAVGRRGKLVFLKAFGLRQAEPEELPMRPDTLFDLASLTKPIATATSVMRLVEQDAIALDDPVAKHLPEFGANGKETITIAELLTHQGGLIADNRLSDYNDGEQRAWDRICQLEPIAAAGEKFVYSDVGFIVLAELVHRVSGKRIDAFSRKEIFQPLGMEATGYLPDADLRERAAPTERRNGQWMRGEVHDPRAYRLGGVAGHAGLFSTAEDLAVYAQMLLDGGTYRDVQVLEAETVRRMTEARDVSRGTRALGWDKQSPYSSNRGKAFSEAAFGHGGFTGTVLWIDPELDVFFVFLSNRLHPDGRGAVNRLAGEIATVIGRSIEREEP